MISVGNVHGRRLGFGKESMVDDTELEEGEAGSYTEETYKPIDPDVDFAYIGEKLHDLLGHHQKEFEGCFTAENLGPKFGAYGSFLPTFKRPPSSVHPTMPQVQVQNNLSKTTTGSLGGSDCFAIQSTACQKEKHKLGSATVLDNPVQVTELKPKSELAKQLPTVAPITMNDSVNWDAAVKAINTTSGDSNQLTTQAARKPLKVRITMNSKKLLPLDNTPNGKGAYLESQDILLKSPNAIITSMTVSPIPRNIILSPLPDYLTYLNINEKEHKGCITIDNHVMDEEWLDSKSSENNFKEKKMRPHSKVDEFAEESDWVHQSSLTENQRIVDGKLYLDVFGEEQSGFGTSHMVEPVNEKQNGTKIKCLDNSYNNCVGHETREPVKNGRCFAGATVNDKATLCLQDISKAFSRVPEGGNRSESNNIQHVSLPCVSKGNQIVGSLVKPGKMHTMPGFNSGSKTKNINMRKGVLKTKDTYKDIFGDMSTDDEDNELIHPETSSYYMNNKPEMVVNKATTASMDKSSVKDSCKKSNEYAAMDVCTSAVSSVSIPTNHGHAEISMIAAPIPILEEWVFCDDCNKWRLLPRHICPDSLPDKWTCRMINWIPEMNSCEVSEDDTTLAVRAMYGPTVPVPENHLKVDADLYGTSYEDCLTEPPPMQTFNSISVPVAAKKKNGSIKMSLHCATKSEQSKSSDFGPEKKGVKMQKKLPDKGVTEKYLTSEKRKEGHHCSSGVSAILHPLNIKADQDQSINDDCLSRKRSKASKNIREVSAKHPNKKLRVSSCNSYVEKQVVNGNHVVNNKRKIKDSSDSGQQVLVNQASQKVLCQDDHKRKKRMRLNESGSYDFVSSDGNGIPHEKGGTVKVQGTKFSKLNMRDADSGKKLRCLENTPLHSSSSKVSSSHKSKVETGGFKTSPIGSVSSLPMYRSKKDRHIIRKRSSLSHDDLVDKSSHNKHEDDLLRSADKSNSSCTINGSKEDASSGQRQKDRRHKVLVNTVVRSCERDNYANTESSKWDVHVESVRHEVQCDLRSFEQPVIKQIKDEGSQCRLLVENIQLDSASGADKLLSGEVLNSRDDKNITRTNLHAMSDTATDDKYVMGPCVLMKSDDQSENQLSCTSHTKDFCRTKYIGEQSVIRKDLLNDAIFVEKEARSLKYIADRFGESGPACEKVAIYFQSALKFLNAASLYELSCCESARLGNRNQAMQIYRSTTKLLEFCATEFQKLNNMCAVALAYKCIEVSCLHVAYSSYTSISKDLLDLQTTAPPGESPSSCFSDVDNLNNVAIVEQASSKRAASPLAMEGLIIPAQNRNNMTQLFTFTEDVDMAMDSSHKALTALMAANSNSVNTHGIPLVKKALDFSFQDVDEFLCLVRIAMEAISGS